MDDSGGETGVEADGTGNRRGLPWLVKYGIVSGLALCGVTLAAYTLLGRYLPDEVSFLLLRILRSLSFLLGIFCLCAIALSIRLAVRQSGQRTRRLLLIGLYLVLCVFGGIMILMSDFIVALARGTG